MSSKKNKSSKLVKARQDVFFPLSPLGEFIKRVCELPEAEREIENDEIKTIGLPMPEIIADGLWMVIYRAASILDTKLETKQQVLAVAERVDRLVNLGLVINFKGDMTLAAESFVLNVIKPAQAKAAKIQSDSLMPSIEIWGEASAQFFSGLTRSAREYGEKIAALNEEIGKKIIASREKEIKYLDFGSFVDLDLILRTLDIRESGTFFNSLIAVVTGALPALRKYFEEISLLSSLPFRLDEIPKDLMNGLDPWTIKHTWINTQLMRAAGNLTDAEYIEFEELKKVLPQLRKLEANEILSRFLRRLAERGWRKSKKMESELLKLAKANLNYLRQLQSTVIDRHYLSNCFLRAKAGDLSLENEVAVEIASGAIGDFSARDTTKTKLFSAIDWPGISTDEFRRMVKGGFLTPEMLVRGILKMPAKRRSAAVAELLRINYSENTRRINEAAMEKLIENGLVEITAQILEDFHDQIPVKIAERELCRLMTGKRKNKPSFDSIHPAAFMKLIIRLPKETVVKILLAAPMRYETALFIGSEIADPNRWEIFGFGREDVIVLREKFSKEEWRLIVFSDLLQIFEGAYTDAVKLKKPLEEEKLPRWENLADHRKNFFSFETKLGECLSVELLKNFSEERVFKWLYADKRDTDHRWKQYYRKREIYYLK